MLKLKPNVRNAILLGCMCSISYLAVYLARDILGVVSPQMIQSSAFSTEQIGTLSSVFFIVYAFGQLINGSIGDKIKARWMISFGLCAAGICYTAMSFSGGRPLVAYIAYGSAGYFLSMIYGPMVKVVSENTEPLYATRSSMGYTVASFIGSPLAGVLAMFLSWQWAFRFGSGVLIAMGVLCFVAFMVLEKKKIVQYNRFSREGVEAKKGGIKVLLQRRIVKYTVISILTGVVRTSVVFWLPTYLSQRLGFAADQAAMLFTVSTLFISLAPFIALFVYEHLQYNMELTVLLMFGVSTVGFVVVFFMDQPIVNAVFLVLAIIASNAVASMLWSRYCPSLYDTGMVSAATGFLDFVSYMAASVASMVFANAVSVIGWSGLVLVWIALMICGVIIALPYDKFKKKDLA